MKADLSTMQTLNVNINLDTIAEVKVQLSIWIQPKETITVEAPDQALPQ